MKYVADLPWDKWHNQLTISSLYNQDKDKDESNLLRGLVVLLPELQQLGTVVPLNISEVLTSLSGLLWSLSGEWGQTINGMADNSLLQMYQYRYIFHIG